MFLFFKKMRTCSREFCLSALQGDACNSINAHYKMMKAYKHKAVVISK
jgi:hypothetical protein